MLMVRQQQNSIQISVQDKTQSSITREGKKKDTNKKGSKVPFKSGRNSALDQEADLITYKKLKSDMSKHTHTVTGGSVLINGDMSSEDEEERYAIDVEDPEQIVEVAIEEVDDLVKIRESQAAQKQARDADQP